MSELSSDRGTSAQWRLVLASSSPRRRELIKFLRVPFEITSSELEEVIDQKLPPDQLVTSLARQKAADVMERIRRGTIPGISAAGGAHRTIVLGADTIVVLDGKYLGKPSDRADAVSMLEALSGRCHEVYTGVVLLIHESNRDAELVGTEISRVFFRPLSDAEIQAYVATEEPMDKAGSYALQGTGSAFVERVDGCVTNIIGLPIPKVVSLLREAGVFVLGST